MEYHRCRSGSFNAIFPPTLRHSNVSVPASITPSIMSRNNNSEMIRDDPQCEGKMDGGIEEFNSEIKSEYENFNSSRVAVLGLNSELNVSSLKDQSILEILQNGDEEFRNKYSNWIEEVFQLQLCRVHRKIHEHYSKRLKAIEAQGRAGSKEKEREFKRIIEDYEEKTEKLYKSIDSLAIENRRLREIKEAEVAEMKKNYEKVNERSFMETQRIVNELEEKFEREKAALNRKHLDQMSIYTTKSEGMVTNVESRFKIQIASLNKLVHELKEHNSILETEMNSGNFPPEFSQKPLNTSHQVDLEQTIVDLNEKVADRENKLKQLEAATEARIQFMKREFDEKTKYFTSNLIEMHSKFAQVVERNRTREKEMKEGFAKQEETYKEAIENIRKKYGKKILNLTRIVENLQLKIQ